MHYSRLAGLVIDCETDDLSRSADFWSQALGHKTKDSRRPEDEGYVLLETKPDEPHIELQAVGHPSRVHIDIETDDVEAEVSRLERLGAKRLRKARHWWIMEAPSGHRFCVIHSDDDLTQKDNVNAWP
ncbi:VOC family protein [Halomonas elongata]|uniref:VOC family protein n=1 Tax=Halomonas elongata TaxID=2746 RepID=UPI0038D4EFF0